MIGAPNTGKCHAVLLRQDAVILQYSLGFTLAADMIEGPCTILCFLGNCSDIIGMEAKLPDDVAALP